MEARSCESANKMEFRMKFAKWKMVAITAVVALLVSTAALAVYHSAKEIVYYDANQNVIGYRIFTCGRIVTSGGEVHNYHRSETLWSRRCPVSIYDGPVNSCFFTADTNNEVLACLQD